jgi:hypothetical protein
VKAGLLMAEWSEEGEFFTLGDTTVVDAPIDRCFQLTCSLALVREELGMNAVDGRTDGLVGDGDTVRWEGWQLGMKHFHVSHISGYNRPVFMQDSMLDGRFKTFQHDHHLRERSDGATSLTDELRFSLPFGWAGRMVSRYIMVPHILRLMRRRFARIKRIAESDDWKRYLASETAVRSSR